jgi:hypothetical protein
MIATRPIHPDFQFLLEFKDQEIIDLFTDLREYILENLSRQQRIGLSYSRLNSSIFNIEQAIRRLLYVANLYKPPKFGV